MKENLYAPHSIRTNSGIYFDFKNPTVDMIRIADIAHGLSHQPRFMGQPDIFYSVAQHSVMCCRMIQNEEYKLAALLHDAAEAYIGDMPSPLKALFPEYKKLEKVLQNLVDDKFGITYTTNKAMHDAVKKVDKEMLELEWDFLLHKKKKSQLQQWPSAVAKDSFLEEYIFWSKQLSRKSA